jgi:stage III sporulation protein AB
MDYKWIGAVLIVAGCGGFGFTLSSEHRRQEKSLRKLIAVLDFMACELQYRLTPLPDLFVAAGKETGGSLGRVFAVLSRELENTQAPDVSNAMDRALSMARELPSRTRDNLLLLGRSMGRFDISGQLSALEAVRAVCRRDLDGFTADREIRLRNYQTLGLCAGAALAILLI